MLTLGIRVWLTEFHRNLKLASQETRLARIGQNDIIIIVSDLLNFQSDRKNSDGDSEVQNPMKSAVQEILKDTDLKSKLDIIQSYSILNQSKFYSPNIHQ